MTDSNTNWFERNPVTITLLVVAFLMLLIEITMHGLYWINLLPRNAIYMTQLEKADYRKNVNQITYEDHVQRWSV